MISGKEISNHCEYNVVDAYNGKPIDRVTAKVNFASKVLQINNFTKGMDYSLKIIGVEMARIWNPENCKLSEFKINYSPNSTNSRSFGFQITGSSSF